MKDLTGCLLGLLAILIILGVIFIDLYSKVFDPFG